MKENLFATAAKLQLEKNRLTKTLKDLLEMKEKAIKGYSITFQYNKEFIKPEPEQEPATRTMSDFFDRTKSISLYNNDMSSSWEKDTYAALISMFISTIELRLMELEKEFNKL